jgi:dTDP-4-dehydrorhamnose reductase
MVLARAQRGEPLELPDDQVMSPTWTRVVADKTLALILSAAEHGLYHMAGRGSCSWYELARTVLRLSQLELAVRPTETPPEPAGAAFFRPRFTALDNERLRWAGLGDLPDWRESLARYLDEERAEPAQPAGTAWATKGERA